MGCGSSKVASVTYRNTEDPNIKASFHIKKDTFTTSPTTASKNVSTALPTLKVEEILEVEELVNRPSDASILSSTNETYTKRWSALVPCKHFFADADERAFSAPDNIDSCKELVEHLTQGLPPVLQLRAVFRWIAENISYDTTQFFQLNSNPTSTVQMLQSRKALCTGYVNMLIKFTSALNLCKVVGWTKGYNHSHETTFQGKPVNHAWCAVYLENTWWLLDPTCASGYIDENKRFVKKFSEHYFLTDPAQFIYHHFPLDPVWQLLDAPITIEEYDNRGKFTRNFFELQLKVLNDYLKIIDCNRSGKVHLKFRLGKEITVECVGTLTDIATNTDCANQIHIYTTEKVLHILVTAPHRGTFLLKLFARNALAEENILPLISSHVIRCDTPATTTSAGTSYPKQFKRWSNGFFLYSPLEGQLQAGKTHTFKVALPGILEMAVCLGGERCSWVSIPWKEGAVWQAEVFIEEGTQRVTVVAKFKHERNSTFSSVLEYSIL